MGSTLYTAGFDRIVMQKSNLPKQCVHAIVQNRGRVKTMGDSLLGYIYWWILQDFISHRSTFTHIQLLCSVNISWTRGAEKVVQKVCEHYFCAHCNLQRSCKYYCNLPKDNLGFIWTNVIILIGTKATVFLCKCVHSYFMTFHFTSICINSKGYMFICLYAYINTS